MAGWFAVSTATRFAGAAAIAAALGVHAPLTAALIIVPTLDLAGLIPFSGNLGITSGAVATALQTHGLQLPQALATGLAVPCRRDRGRNRLRRGRRTAARRSPRILVLAAAGATACVAAAFCATVLLPLA
jgi:hypothetical protein